MNRLLAAVAWCLAAATAGAQVIDDTPWQEAEVPPPPAFQLDRLIRFEVNPGSSLVYAIDPQTLAISTTDRVVRYVVVASSPTGARNVFYEGIRCPAAQVKTYAYYTGQGWVKAQDPQWVPMATRMSRHALQLARQGACDGNGTPLLAEDVVRALSQKANAAGGR